MNGILIPTACKFHMEIPRLYGTPNVHDGSFIDWEFTAKTGAQTGKRKNRRAYFRNIK